jgi:hypothetical protein
LPCSPTRCRELSLKRRESDARSPGVDSFYKELSGG